MLATYYICSLCKKIYYEWYERSHLLVSMIPRPVILKYQCKIYFLYLREQTKKIMMHSDRSDRYDFIALAFKLEVKRY